MAVHRKWEREKTGGAVFWESSCYRCSRSTDFECKEKISSPTNRRHLLLIWNTGRPTPPSIFQVFIDFPHNTFLSRELRAPSVVLPVFWDMGSLGMRNWVSSQKRTTAGIADYLQSAQGKEEEWLGKGCKDGMKPLLLHWFMDYVFLMVRCICLQIFFWGRKICVLLDGCRVKNKDSSISFPVTRSTTPSFGWAYLLCDKAKLINL